MKRVKKIVALLLCMAFCLPLCSCKELDDMRAQHAILQEDGTILWNGQVYKELPTLQRELMLEEDENWISVTLPDVPVLLSERFDEFTAISMGDGVILLDYDSEWYSYYCRADRYDELVAAMEADAPMTGYCYSYSSIKDGKMENYTLTDEQVAAVRAALAEGVFVDSSQVYYIGFDLYACSEDGWFCEEACRINYSEHNYYLTLSQGGNNEYIQVPEEYEPIFAEIVAKDRENMFIY